MNPVPWLRGVVLVVRSTFGSGLWRGVGRASGPVCKGGMRKMGQGRRLGGRSGGRMGGIA